MVENRVRQTESPLSVIPKDTAFDITRLSSGTTVEVELVLTTSKNSGYLDACTLGNFSLKDEVLVRPAGARDGAMAYWLRANPHEQAMVNAMAVVSIADRARKAKAQDALTATIGREFIEGNPKLLNRLQLIKEIGLGEIRSVCLWTSLGPEKSAEGEESGK